MTQVTPLELTTKLMDAAIRGGATLVKGRVEGVRLEGGSRLTGLVVDGQTLPADKVGAWGGKGCRAWGSGFERCAPRQWQPLHGWWWMDRRLNSSLGLQSRRGCRALGSGFQSAINGRYKG